MLQTYACKELFKEYGKETVLIDYYRESDYNQEAFKNVFIYYSFRNRNQHPKGIKNKIVLVLKSFASFRTTKRFYNICDSFLTQNICLTKPYQSIQAINDDPPAADIYCAGSDQIWNSDYNNGINETYYLAFAPDNSRKISFASSIGMDLIPPKENEHIKKLLSDFSCISVREEKAEELLESIGIESVNLIDPTLILNKERWSQMSAAPVISEPYLLLYKLKGDNTIDSLAHKIAKQRDLKIVRISFGSQRHISGETVICLPEISEFISLIKNASFVVTNSFHGTCFSINFNRQFYSFARGNYNSRIMNILKKVGLTNRFLSSNIPHPQLASDIDYSAVNIALESERKRAKKWLAEAINDT